MRIPDPMLKCAGFIGRADRLDDTGRVHGELVATGFIVSVPCESLELDGQAFTYFVTARHVARDLKDEQVYFVVNRKGGGICDTITSPDNAWWLHPADETADVAVVQIALPREADVIAITVGSFGLPARLDQLHVGIGDEVHAIGLFTPAPGEKETVPIVRHGNIAMMPKEQIQTELGYADVYLIEARSIGGISGSPVFVRPTHSQQVGKNWHFALGHGETLLGLMHGHWDIDESRKNEPKILHDQRGVNLGIAVVVPAYKIHEAIYSPGLVAMRKEYEKVIINRNAPRTDSLKPKGGPSLTQEDFQDALKRATRKIGPLSSDKPTK